MGSTVMAYIGTASTVMADILVAVVYCCTSSNLMTNMPTCHDRRAAMADRSNYMVMASTIVASTIMAPTGMAHIVMAYRVMARILKAVELHFVSLVPSCERAVVPWTYAPEWRIGRTI